MNSRYRVQPGDTVSTIISRVQGRTLGLWPAVEIVFAANPDAFVDQDVNRLMAGSVLVIPGLTRGAEPVQPALSTASPASTETVESASRASGESVPTDLSDITVAPPVSTATPAEDAGAESIAPATLEAAGDDAAASQRPVLRPGDVVMPPINSSGPEIVIPDTTINNDVPSVPVVSASQAESAAQGGGWGWLLWLGGTGTALILGLLLFGRSLRERFGSAGDDLIDVPARRRDDDPTQRNRAIKGVDFEFEDSVNAHAISLDADVVAGTGLNPGSDMDVAQDFGFSTAAQSSASLDMELTEQDAYEPEQTPTDVIPPHHRDDVSTILESEVPPESADDATAEYDLSMIVDATKQSLDEYDKTAKDLQAVQVESMSEDFADDVDDYTVSSAVDYQTLEQDYEDEMTATQILRAEMEQAARDLTEQTAEMDTDQVTAEMPIAPIADQATAGKATVELPEVSDPDMTAELTANLPTTYEAENDSMADDGAEITVEMSAAGSDITVDMQVESGRIDTSRKRKRK